MRNSLLLISIIIVEATVVYAWHALRKQIKDSTTVIDEAEAVAKIHEIGAKFKQHRIMLQEALDAATKPPTP